LNEKGIVPQAYSPLGSSNSPLLTDEVVVQIAEKHSLQSSDILLGYLRMVISTPTYGDNNKIHLNFSCQGNRCAS
jgi:glycerol 2-dehydrogenase (NADP+)